MSHDLKEKLVKFAAEFLTSRNVLSFDKDTTNLLIKLGLLEYQTNYTGVSYHIAKGIGELK